MLINTLLKPSNTYGAALLNSTKSIGRPLKNASVKSKAGIFTLTMTAKNKTGNVRINVTLRCVRANIAAVKSNKTYII